MTIFVYSLKKNKWNEFIVKERKRSPSARFLFQMENELSGEQDDAGAEKEKQKRKKKKNEKGIYTEKDKEKKKKKKK